MNKPKLIKPVVGGDISIWGDKLNSNIDSQDMFNQELIEDSSRQDQELARLERDKISQSEIDTVVKNTVDNYVDNTSKPQLNHHVETVNKPELDNYTDTKKLELNNLTTLKKEELNAHEKVKEVEITQFAEAKKDELVQYVDTVSKVEINSHTENKKQEIDSFTEEQKAELDAHEKLKEGQLDVHEKTKESQLDSHVETVNKVELKNYVDSKKSEIDSFTEEQKAELDAHEKLKEGQLDAYEKTKESQLDSHVETVNKVELKNYVDSKKSEIDSFTEEQKVELDVYEKAKESEITSHTSEKILEINSHVTTKKNEINTFTEEQKVELDQHEKVKEIEIANYVEDKKEELVAYVDATSKVEIDRYTSVKKEEIDSFTEEQKLELDSYENIKESELDAHKTLKISEIDTYVDSVSKIDINNYTNTKKAEINTFTDEQKVELDSYEKTKETQLEEYVATVSKVDINNHSVAVIENINNTVSNGIAEIIDVTNESTEKLEGLADVYTKSEIDEIISKTGGVEEFEDYYSILSAEGKKDKLYLDKEEKKIYAYDTKEKDYYAISGDRIGDVEEFDNYNAILGTEGKKNKLYLDKEEKKIYAYNIDEGAYYVISGGGSGGDGNITVQRNIRIINNLPSKNITANKEEPCKLNFTFISQERESSEDPFVDTGERGECQISIKNSKTESFVVVSTKYIQSGIPYETEDISEFLTGGANQVMIKITGEITEITAPSIVYSVQITTLAISADNYRWWIPITTDSFFIPINILGNISKKLYIKVSGKDYIKEYSFAIGTTIYNETPYQALIENPAGGVFKIEIYATNSDGSLKTLPIEYNTIFVKDNVDEKLVAINNIAKTLTNWETNNVLSYCVYDGGKVTTNMNTKIVGIYENISTSVLTGTKIDMVAPIEVETEDNEPFMSEVIIYDDNAVYSEDIKILTKNDFGFSATSNYSVLIDPKRRDNSQNNRESFVNEVTSDVFQAQWSGFNWSNDGWIRDSEGNKVLRTFAGSFIEVDYKPFERESARLGLTLEIDFCANNSSNNDDPIIDISEDKDSGFVGLKVYSDKVVMNSSSMKNYDSQSLYMFEGKRTRLTLTILPNAYGNDGFNLCILYINGVKNREFAYLNNDYFTHTGKLRIGNTNCDVDIYAVRQYNFALTSNAVLNNYVNLLTSVVEKKEVVRRNNILDTGGSDIEFENTKNKYNTFVFSGTIPDKANQTRNKGVLEVYFADKPEWNAVISDVEARGQGTSSMAYYKWNTRYTVDKSSIVTYADGSTTTGVWKFTPNSIAGNRFTAKKNYASSMQSHKIGAVNAYNDLYRAMGYKTEAMKTEQYRDSRVSVYQYPFFAFEKTINEEDNYIYTFKGIYTFGADKGDSSTFGYDTTMFPKLISLEGCDNSPLLTLFRIPWDSRYVEHKEGIWQFDGQNSWELSAGNISNQQKFIDAYEIAYGCSPRIKPFEGTIEELVAKKDDLDIRNADNEWWITTGDKQFGLYYYNTVVKDIVESTISGVPVNLKTQLSDKGYGLSQQDLLSGTSEDKNQLFINARIAKFRKEAGDYWNIDETLYFMNNVEFNAGTDERAKNTYPYCFGNEGSKFSWRADDMDTRFDITNRGLATKPYSVETYDVDEDGTPYWNGVTNNFFNLMEMAFTEEKNNNMRLMLSTMETLSGMEDGNNLDKIVGFYSKYFWKSAQEYFPQSAFNADTKFCYEDGKLAYIKGSYFNDTDPIEQALGDHFMAEMRWVTKRAIYMMSKYSYGLFDKNGADSITVRASGSVLSYQLTPAMDLYPTIVNGTTPIRGKRVKAGEICEMFIDLSGSGDQQNIIQGASYLKDIGDWYDKSVNGSMIIQGKMLTDIRLGHKTKPVSIAINSLTISNCDSLQNIQLSNISTLSTSVDLSKCTHLKTIHMDGTNIPQVVLPEGGGLIEVLYSPVNTYLTLRNQPNIHREGIHIEQCKTKITDFFMQCCPNISSIDVLCEIIESQKSQGTSHALKRIRCVGINEEYEDGRILSTLAQVCDGTYVGLDSNGVATSGYPELSGVIKIKSFAYHEDVQALNEKFKGLEIIVNGYAKKFIDKEVERVLAETIDSNRDGFVVDKEVEEALTYGIFTNNKAIKEFDELYDFTKINEVFANSFANSTIERITMPKNAKVIKKGAFMECSNLSKVSGIERIEVIESSAFEGCKNLEITSLNDKITEIPTKTFYNCNKVNLNLDSMNINIVEDYAFANTNITLSSLPYSSGIGAFQGCKNLIADKLISNFDGITISQDVLVGCSCSDEGHVTIKPQVKQINKGGLSFDGIKTVEILTSTITIDKNAFNTDSPIEIRVPWASGDVANAPWGATNAIIKYNCKPISEFFEDVEICNFIMKDSKFTNINIDSFKDIEFFGSDSIATATTKSWFENKTITSWKGMELLTGLKSLTIRGSKCLVETIILDYPKIISLAGAFEGCSNIKNIVFKNQADDLIDIQSFVTGCTNLTIELPPMLKNVTTLLSLTGLDSDGFTIYYISNSDVNSIEQVRYHENGVSQYTKSSLNYSRLDIFTPDSILNIFTDNEIAIYIAQSLSKNTTDIVTMDDLDRIQYFGFEGEQLSDSISYFKGKTITTFKGCRFLRNIKNIYLKEAIFTSQNIDMNFSGATSLQNLYGMLRDTSMVAGTKLTVRLGNTSNVTNMDRMFYSCSSLTSLDLSNFDTSNVTNMDLMFYSCSSLTSLDLSNFDTSNVTNMDLMFYSCSSLTSLDLSNFDTSNVTNMDRMFYSCSSLTSLDLSNFDTSNVTNMYYMFGSCSSLTSLDLSNFDTSNVTNMDLMFYSCSSLTSLDLSNFDTSNVTNMYRMFGSCSKLTSLDLSNFDTSNVTNVDLMFGSCSKLTSLDLSNFDTSNVTNMNYMFDSCSSLTSLDLSNFDTSNVTNMYYMFSGCSSLTSLDLSNFDTSNVTNMDYMFSGCSSLTSLDLSNFDTSNVTNMDYMFSGCSSLTSLVFPALLPKVTTALSATYLDMTGRIIVYAFNPNVTAKSQIKYHNTDGTSQYTKSTLDYSRLVNIPNNQQYTLAMSADEYPDALINEDYNKLILNDIIVSSRAIEKMKAGEFRLPVEGKYRFLPLKDDVLVDGTEIVCLYSKTLDSAIEEVKREDLDILKLK